MANMSQLPPNVQERIQRLQQLQNTLQQLLIQKQRLELEMNESKRALTTLNDITGDAKVYRSVGPILVEKEKDKVIKELTDRTDFLDMRSGVLEKQEQKTRGRIKELQETLQKELNIAGIS